MTDASVAHSSCWCVNRACPRYKRIAISGESYQWYRKAEAMMSSQTELRRFLHGVFAALSTEEDTRVRHACTTSLIPLHLPQSIGCNVLQLVSRAALILHRLAAELLIARGNAPPPTDAHAVDSTISRLVHQSCQKEGQE